MLWIKARGKLINAALVQSFYISGNQPPPGASVIVVYHGGGFESFSEHPTVEKAKETLSRLYDLLTAPPAPPAVAPPAPAALPAPAADDPAPAAPAAPSPAQWRNKVANAFSRLDQSVVADWRVYMHETYGSAAVAEIAPGHLESLHADLVAALKEAGGTPAGTEADAPEAGANPP